MAYDRKRQNLTALLNNPAVPAFSPPTRIPAEALAGIEIDPNTIKWIVGGPPGDDNKQAYRGPRLTV